MGYGEYDLRAHEAATKARAERLPEQIFAQGQCHPTMNPYGVKVRESRDSAKHPNSVGVIFALDVSGSMGEIPVQLATKTLPSFMEGVSTVLPDAQVMFMAVGNGHTDRAPLQVGQFESEASRIDQWLERMYLEGQGGGLCESYCLAMHFAARHTAMDCLEKRGRKGYLFLTGDEPPNDAVARSEVEGLIGDGLGADIPLAEIVEETKRSFEPFYLIPDLGRAANVGAAWKTVFGPRAIAMHSPDDTSHVAAGLVALVERAVPNLSSLVTKYRVAGLSQERCDAVADALRPFAASIGLGD